MEAMINEAAWKAASSIIATSRTTAKLIKNVGAIALSQESCSDGSRFVSATLTEIRVNFKDVIEPEL